MFSVIILSAGIGSRFCSYKSKLFHNICGITLFDYVLENVKSFLPTNIFEVINKNSWCGNKSNYKDVIFCEQDKLLGSADAVKSVPIDKIKDEYVLIMYGDTPFVSKDTVYQCLDMAKKEDCSSVILSFKSEDKKEYGKIALDQSGNVCGIIEKNQDFENYMKISSFCNAGILIKTEKLKQHINDIKKNDSTGEYFLTDIINIFYKNGYKNNYFLTSEEELLGINTRFDFIKAENIAQEKLRNKIISCGVTLLDPKTTYFSYDTVIGKDVIVYPNVQFLNNVVIMDKVTIYGNCVLEDCVIENEAVIGPFARIRGKTKIRKSVKIGNFVEVKNSIINHGAKINHLSYIGDSFIGNNTNIGAGSITCNYDGKNKNKTEIGNNVFVGSNVSMVAPIKIGDNVVVGAGSVITKDIENGDLCFERNEQKVIKNGGIRYKNKKCAE